MIKLLFSLEFYLQCLIIIVPVIYTYQVSSSKGHWEPLVAWRQKLLFTFDRWISNHRESMLWLTWKCLWDSGGWLFPRSFLKRSGGGGLVLSRVQLLWSQWLSPARLLCPWDFPGKSTGVGCHFLLPRIFPTQGSNPHLLHSRRILYQWQGFPKRPDFSVNKLDFLSGAYSGTSISSILWPWKISNNENIFKTQFTHLLFYLYWNQPNSSTMKSYCLGRSKYHSHRKGERERMPQFLYLLLKWA